MFQKRKAEDVSEYDKHINKIAAVKASQSVVGIVSHNVPVELCENFDGYLSMIGPPAKRAYFYSSGIVLESTFSDEDRNYLTTILAPACIFKYIDTDKIDIDVYGFSGIKHKAKLLACDFHYNLSLVTINSDSQLPTAVLTGIDDVLSIDPDDQPHLRKKKKKKKTKKSNNIFLGLQPCSPLFKVTHGTQLVSVLRSHVKPCHLRHGSGTLCLRNPLLKKLERLKDPRCTFNELYEIKDNHSIGLDGAAVLNPFGKVIGILFDTSLFLPSNVVLRWWNHYKSFGGFRRPYLGMEVANLHESDFNTLAQFTTSFPYISAAVVVTKVEGDSLAFHSGIRPNDVIVKLDGKLVRSKMEFYETVWEKVGKAVEVDVLRETDGKELSVSLVIEEASPNQFHEWPHAGWNRVW